MIKPRLTLLLLFSFVSFNDSTEVWLEMLPSSSMFSSTLCPTGAGEFVGLFSDSSGEGAGEGAGAGAGAADSALGSTTGLSASAVEDKKALLVVSGDQVNLLFCVCWTVKPSNLAIHVDQLEQNEISVFNSESIRQHKSILTSDSVIVTVWDTAGWSLRPPCSVFSCQVITVFSLM